MMIKAIEGGICAAKGFSAAGIYCGIRMNPNKKDLALIKSSVRASAAAVYTTNLVKGAPLTVTKQHLADGKAQAVICNSGNANTCNADGEEIALGMCSLAADALGIDPKDVVVASTGVIGQPLDLKPIADGMEELAAGLDTDGSTRAIEGIMTTDTVRKSAAVEFELGGKVCRLGGIAKGSGMIHPNMATMLVFITTDAAISPALLQKALSCDIQNTFNMLSVDGDTSTNDMVVVLANGMAENEEITQENEDFTIFMKVLNTVNVALCRMIAADGEGATKLLECEVSGAKDEETAQIAAKSVICSSLLKAAMFGADANWGRILDAMGYSGFFFTPEKTSVSFLSREGAKRYFEDGNVNGGKESSIKVFDHGVPLNFDEDLAKKILTEEAVDILVELEDGKAKGTAWGCDLTYDYVKINGDYRT